MSMAPWWCGTIIATKSSPVLPEGWIYMPVIILVMAALLSATNADSSACAAVAARTPLQAIKATPITTRLGLKRVAHTNRWIRHRIDKCLR
jgi:hypothetical protein